MSKDLSLINFSNSILKRYGVKTFHDSIKEIDEIIKDKKKIVVFLCDGMGQHLLDVNKEVAKDFINHKFITITSTYPPTTVAATTALLSAKYPIETGYMAWSIPVDNFKANMDVFTKKDSQSEELLPKRRYSKQLKDYQTIFSIIRKVNKEVSTYGIFQYPVDQSGPKNMYEALEYAYKAAYSSDTTFTYVYMTNPDHDAHDYGISSKQVKNDIKLKNDLITQFAKDNPDLTILVIADHGQINIESLILEDYKDIYQLITYHPSFEARSPNFKIKEGQKEKFKELFIKYFGEYFELYTKEEVLEQQLFGYAKPLNNADQLIGDFLAVSISNKALFVTKEEAHFIGHHGGGNKEEMLIDVIAYNYE